MFDVIQTSLDVFADVELLGKIGTLKADIDRLCKRVQSKARRVRVGYEAGPCGYGLYRELVERGFDCVVCAPSLIPKKPGERVKTDRRDAVKLVRALRAGDLSAVHVPDVEDEAFRDLARAWAAAKADLRQARQRLKSFLLSHDVLEELDREYVQPFKRAEMLLDIRWLIFFGNLGEFHHVAAYYLTAILNARSD